MNSQQAKEYGIVDEIIDRHARNWPDSNGRNSKARPKGSGIMKTRTGPEEALRCSFCHKSQDAVPS